MNNTTATNDAIDLRLALLGEGGATGSAGEIDEQKLAQWQAVAEGKQSLPGYEEEARKFAPEGSIAKQQSVDEEKYPTDIRAGH